MYMYIRPLVCLYANFCCVYSVFVKAKCFAVKPLPCCEVRVYHRGDVL